MGADDSERLPLLARRDGCELRTGSKTPPQREKSSAQLEVEVSFLVAQGSAIRLFLRFWEPSGFSFCLFLDLFVGSVAGGSELDPRNVRHFLAIGDQKADSPGFLLRHITSDEVPAPQFSVDRAAKACRTPRRNAEVEEMEKYMMKLSSWSAQVWVKSQIGFSPPVNTTQSNH